jgi:hypothetical protein
MDQMAVDIDQAGAVIGFVHQMIVPDLVVQGCRFGHELKAPGNVLRERALDERKKAARLG